VRVRGSGRSVCAVSEAIIERMQPSGPAIVVPNGVEPAEWASPGAPPAWFAALPRPRLLYTGALDSRLDLELVRRTARRHSGGSVVLVGKLADEGHISPLRELPNVHVRPPVRRAELAALIAASDACLLPHVRSRLTTAMSPLKVYEYLAGGRPVAAIDLPPVRDIDPRVVLADDPDGFAEAVDSALAAGPATEAERDAFIDKHSWRRRHERLLEFALR